ncbi:MAG: hypothetical protein RBT16_00330 [Desulfococcus multivorans]|jgi:hypothetical protein|nr:hypothetical protein [Desulfococcus multivorans]
MAHEDFSEALADEVLTDMANNFFGDRVQLEEHIKLLHKTADMLRLKEGDVNDKAAFLGYLMVTPQAARSLYEAIGVDAEAFPVKGELIENALPDVVPSALTRKGEYVKWVLWAYEALAVACHNYNHGTLTDRPEKGRIQVDDADYRLLESMCILINEEVDRINSRCLPSQILQAAKRFDQATQAKEHFTGGGTYYGDECSLNRDLAFKHIEFSSLNVKKMPELPDVDAVRNSLIKAAKANYVQNKARINDMMNFIRERCRSAAEK